MSVMDINLYQYDKRMNKRLYKYDRKETFIVDKLL